MSTADHILDQIDTALHDRTVSRDAMRSTPGPIRPVLEAPRFVIVVDTAAVMERLREVSAALAAFADAMRQARPPSGSKSPLPRRDRPAWQTPYGPAPRRRRA